MGDLLELAARVEALKGPDREVDCLIEMACGPDGPAIQQIIAGSPHNTIDEVAKTADREGGKLFFRVPRYTASLDAAMTLVPTDGGMKMLSTEFTYEPDQPEVWAACVVRWYPPAKTGADWHCQISSGATPALSVVAATLHARARTQSSTQQESEL